jgi:hypothetical protein
VRFCSIAPAIELLKSLSADQQAQLGEKRAGRLENKQGTS